VDPDKCIGCGVCTITCLTEALKLRRYERPTRPFDTPLEFGMTVARDNDRL
jgi:ferredoxin